MRQFYIAFILGFVLASNSVSAQHEEREHDHHRHEIGMANAPVYFLKEKEYAYGLHLHYVYNLHDKPFGLGLGYEQIFDEHSHQTFSAVFSYRPVGLLNLIVSPGLTKEKDGGPMFATHFEASYEVEIRAFHIGPVAEVAVDPEDIHISLGLHIGIGF